MRDAAAIASDLRASSAAVPGHRGVRLAARPLTNADLLGLVASGLGDDNAESYRSINVFNPALPIQRCDNGHLVLVDVAYLDHPIVGISWSGAADAAALLGGRLPSVNEWEAAATGAAGSVYPWGDDDPTPAHANFDEHMGMTTPVHAYPPSAAGLFDLAGNAGEWCAEDASLARAASRCCDRQRWAFGDHPVKGGGWNKPASLLRNDASRHRWGRIGAVAVGVRVAFDE